jgi:hypothetical protein
MKFKKFLKFFPPPKFLATPYAGLSISDNTIRCIQFDKNSKGLYIKKYSEKPIPPGVVVSGFINNPDEIVHILEEIKKEQNITYLKVSLPEEKAYLFTTKIPKVKPTEVRNTIEFNIEENVPLPASELIFDYSVSDDLGHEDHVDVVVSALPTNIVDRYVDTLSQAGFPILSLEIESQAMARALILPDDIETRLIVHYGREKVGLYVVYKRVVHFTSTILMKNEARTDTSLISQEIKRLYVYWHTLKDNAGQEHKKISQIIVCGESIPEGIVAHLSSSHNTETVLGNVWTNAFDLSKDIPPIPFADSLRFTASIGLALPSNILI